MRKANAHLSAISKGIWCAADKARAWEDWMRKSLRPSGKPDCPNPIEQIDSMATKLNIDTTPTLVFADGGVIKQYAGAVDIERFLNDTPGATPAAKPAKAAAK